MTDFKPALPRPVKWSVGENRYDQTGKTPMALSLFVPVESAYALAQYIMNTADDQSKHRSGKIWDYEAKSEVEVEGFYINGKGRDGANGSFGTINPQSNAIDTGKELPF